MYSRQTLLETVLFGIEDTLFGFIHFFSNYFFKQKRLTVKIDSVVSSGGQGKLTYSVPFAWPLLEAEP